MTALTAMWLVIAAAQIACAADARRTHRASSFGFCLGLAASSLLLALFNFNWGDR